MCVGNKHVSKCLPSGLTSNPYTSTINVNTVDSRQCYTRFEVFVAVMLKITVFWDVTLCSEFLLH